MAFGVVGRNQWLNIFLLFYTLYSLMCGLTSATVSLLLGKNVSILFEDIAANFAPEVKSNGVCGNLYAADPIDACSTLTNDVNSAGNNSSPFALIVRGGCSFEEKVRIAQEARFEAVIVYDNVDGGSLVAMAGNSAGIKIPAVFVSRASGEILKKYADISSTKLSIFPSMEDSAWSIIAISIISLLAMSAALATCFFVRRHHMRREPPRRPMVRQFHGMSSFLVKNMPSLIFTEVLEDNCTAATCAICLEDYRAGDKLRILPCCHKFHSLCVDSWLTTWRTFCPVCKRDAKTATGDPPASESTPLLLSSSPSSSVAFLTSSSTRSSLGSSSAIQIAPPSPHSRNHFPSNTPQIPPSQPTYHHRSPSMSVGHSSYDPRNMSSSSRTRRSPASHLVSLSPHSLGYGYPSPSPLNSRCNIQYFPSPNIASAGYLGALRRPQNQNPLHHCQSATSFSPFACTHSFPGC